LYQVVFALQNAPAPALELPGLTITSSTIGRAPTPTDLMLIVQDAGGELIALAVYNADLFDTSTITELLLRLRLILETITACPEQRLLDIPLSLRPQDSSADADLSQPSKYKEDKFVF
jgi:hypothetical protein